MANDEPERIVSIQTIAGVGNWDYVYPASNEPKDFQRINLIYGPNGSGKTSLANMFYGLSHDWPDAGMRTWDKVSLKVRKKDGTTLDTEQKDDAIFSRVCVFTRDMVSRSHALTVDDASMSAILTLGEERVDREQRISVLEERLGRVRDDLKEVEKRRKECEDELDNLISKFQDSIFEALARYKKWTTKGSFKKPKAKEMLMQYIERKLEYIERLLERGNVSDEDVAVSLESIREDELNAYRGTLSAGELQRFSDLTYINESMIRRIADINKAICRIPSVCDIDTLDAHPHASNWVQQGIALHGESDECIFCGAPLSVERMNALRAHFSQEVEELQAELRGYSRLFEAEEEDIEQLTRSLDGLIEQFETRHDLRGLVAVYKRELDVYQEWVRSSKRIVDSKLDNVMMASSQLLDAVNVPDKSGLAEWIAKYNAEVDDQDLRKQTASERICDYYCAQYACDYRQAERNLAAAVSEESCLTNEEGQVDAELTSLNNVSGDPVPSAESLNRRVADLLGREELRFEIEGDHYLVTRNGGPATRLSEGEQTAITFVHFIEMVEVDIANGGAPIVVIDDPVSSLDERIQYGVASVLKALITSWDAQSKKLAASAVAQLFILTHSFDYFRYLACSLPRDQKLGPMSVYEILSVNKLGLRHPSLVDWLVLGKDFKKRMEVFSSYHHAFGLLGRCVENVQRGGLDGVVDRQLLYPNLARRLIEQFLAFKYPHKVTVFSEAVAEAAGRARENCINGSASSLDIENAISVCENIVLPATNVGSHNRMPTTVGANSGQQLDILIRQVFYFIYLVDSSHFAGMCEALEFDDQFALLPSSVRLSHGRP